MKAKEKKPEPTKRLYSDYRKQLKTINQTEARVAYGRKIFGRT